MFDQPPRYRIFLLTLWEERTRNPALPPVWRFRLEDPRTGKQRGFAGLEALAATLEAETGGTRGTIRDDGCLGHSQRREEP
jgi:hypothetical protein